MPAYFQLGKLKILACMQAKVEMVVPPLHKCSKLRH